MGWCMPGVAHTPVALFHTCSAKTTTTTTQVLRLSTHWRLLRRRSAPALGQTPRIHAIHGSDYIFAAIKSPAATGDYSVFIPISAGFFFLYWIANFVVPGMIVRDLNKEDSGEKQGRKERIPSEDEK